jgi:hypothetical protein
MVVSGLERDSRRAEGPTAGPNSEILRVKCLKQTRNRYEGYSYKGLTISEGVTTTAGGANTPGVTAGGVSAGGVTAGGVSAGGATTGVVTAGGAAAGGVSAGGATAGGAGDAPFALA